MEETISFEAEGYSSFAREQCDSFRLSNYLCDVIIVGKEGERHPAHRIMLAAASPYFRAMFDGNFLESQKPEITISNIDDAVLKHLIEYAYRGKIECRATLHDVQCLYEGAHYLQFDRLLQMCSDWIKHHVDSSNCLSYATFAHQYDDSTLRRLCDRISAVNIMKLVDTDDFRLLSVDHVTRLLSHDELGVRDENDVVGILHQWIKHDETSRRHHAENLATKVIRLPLIDYSNETSSLDILSNLDSSSSSSSSSSCQRRVGCEGVLLVAIGSRIYNEDTNKYDFDSRAQTYDAYSDTWTSFPSLEVQRCEPRIATSFGVTYALGGRAIDFEVAAEYKSSRLAVVERYDPERRRWIDDVASMSTPRSRDEIVCCADRIYGMSLARDEATCEVFDSTTGTWTPVASPGGGERRFRSGYFLSSLAGKIFAIGRERSSGTFGHMPYDPSENRWLDFRPNIYIKSIGSSSIHYGSIDDRLYIFTTRSVEDVFDGRSESFIGDNPFHACSLQRGNRRRTSRSWLCMTDERKSGT
ncbi:kelch-like protein 20 [Oscarella lobularis]|uniref:kelch-like protein 20 n=1 Tax=Oscarella lobularis TaxID=121494 RepID=UPI0033143512